MDDVQYRGYKLPGDKGLETEINTLGVSSKQTDKARQALMRSARQAGFLASGEDRLVRPSVQGPGTPPIVDISTGQEDNKHGNGGGNGNGTGKGDSDGGRSELPFFVRGLLKSLPTEDSNWTSEDRVKWLEAAAKCFDLMYGGGEGKISIHLTKDGSASGVQH